MTKLRTQISACWLDGVVVSFAVARVALAVGSALAAVLCCHSHLRSLKECLLSNADNKGLGGSLLREAHVRIHLASVIIIKQAF
jgi:hypothetical protein